MTTDYKPNRVPPHSFNTHRCDFRSASGNRDEFPRYKKPLTVSRASGNRDEYPRSKESHALKVCLARLEIGMSTRAIRNLWTLLRHCCSCCNLARKLDPRYEQRPLLAPHVAGVVAEWLGWRPEKRVS